MYEIFVYNHKTSYCFYDDVIDASKHPHIELGSYIFIPGLNVAYIALGPGKWVPLNDEKEPEVKLDEPAAATLGDAVLDDMVLGEWFK